MLQIIVLDFCDRCCVGVTNTVQLNKGWKFLKKLWRRANARNVSFILITVANLHFQLSWYNQITLFNWVTVTTEACPNVKFKLLHIKWISIVSKATTGHDWNSGSLPSKWGSIEVRPTRDEGWTAEQFYHTWKDFSKLIRVRTIFLKNLRFWGCRTNTAKLTWQ